MEIQDSRLVLRASDGRQSPLDQQLVAAIKEGNLSLFSELLTPFQEMREHSDDDDDIRVLLKDTFAAADRAAIFGQIGFLRAIYQTAARDETILESVSLRAAKHGDLICLRLARQVGFPWHPHAALTAAKHGHADCLEFAMPLCSPVSDYSFGLAMEGGHLACVKLLVAAGSPREPYLHRVWRSPAEVQLLPCLQHMFDMGCGMHPGNIITAARAGNLDYVRFLHEHGIPLWTRACVAAPLERGWFGSSGEDRYCLRMNILPIPADMLRMRGSEGCDSPERVIASGVFDVLRWGYACGAPVTPAVDEAIRALRAATRAVLQAFHGAARVRRGEGTRAKRVAWAAMHAVPPDLVREIVVKAGLEIPESFGRRLPAQRLVEGRDVWPKEDPFYNVLGVAEFTTWGYPV